MCFNCRVSQYAHVRTHWLCLDCRAAWKSRYARASSSHCPQCGQLGMKVSHGFRPPKQRDKKGWARVEVMFDKNWTRHLHSIYGDNIEARWE